MSSVLQLVLVNINGVVCSFGSETQQQGPWEEPRLRRYETDGMVIHHNAWRWGIDVGGTPNHGIWNLLVINW